MSSTSSSITPAANAWRTVEAPPRDQDLAVARGGHRLRVGGVKAVGDEVKRRTALHFDRLVGVVREHEHGRMVGRLLAPPPAPFLVPLTADRTEHVPAHHIGTTLLGQVVAGAGVSLVERLSQVPLVQPQAADTDRVVASLFWPGDVAVKGD
jgi:hypothetical protein